MGFSARDYRGTLADGDNLALVTNGEEVFALVRTADCTAPRQRVNHSELASWEMRYDHAVSRGRSTGRLDEELWKVNLEICERLGYAFYRGMWGEPLLRVYRPRSRRATR
jgi:hypothetical protein